MAVTALKTETVEVPIQASGNEIEPAWQTRLGTTWMHRTRHPLDTILAPGYYDTVAGHGLRVNDRIEVISLATIPATHATLSVDEIRHPDGPEASRVFTRLLTCSEPKRTKK